ncbi:cupin domain-containing protein [Fluviispira multicolorata]|uniref:AraC-like ligand binding domain-containing protein n=1 Tax=Fluviispira multicolorata TaxID=2654512 RepID=A0A833JCS4_9BACT|nr:hypothetical protein [Fluviispira multicolorata]KAB8029965.1 hypothetical protein GCL57_10540 [Fluviispira multicolorata]
MTITRTLLRKDKNIFVVKLNLQEGDFIPEHNSKAVVTAIVVSGEGEFKIEEKTVKLTSGVYLEMMPFENHSIRASKPLELVVHHILLDEIHSHNDEKLCSMQNA